MIGIRLLLVVTTITGLASHSVQRAPRFWGNLEPGAYAVGLRVDTFLDRSRGDSTRGGRPIQITTWYPASPSNGSVGMSVADYFRLATQVPPDTPSHIDSLRRSLSTAMTSEPEGIDTSVLDQILASRMMAVRDAAPLKESYPLVLWTARHGTIVAQSVLSEYLASHGYVVAFARYQGPAMPLPYEAKSTEVKLATLREHVSDLRFALRTLQTRQHVEPKEKVGLISWSYAGESATLLQMENVDVGVVISLSSNVLDGWVYQGSDALSRLDASRLSTPYVILTERVGTNGTIRTAPPILKRLPNNSYFISFAELAHGNFNATEGMIPSLMEISNVPRWSKSGPVAQLGYETVSRFTRRFLDASLKTGGKQPQPLTYSDLSKGLPQGFVTIGQHGANVDEWRQ